MNRDVTRDARVEHVITQKKNDMDIAFVFPGQGSQSVGMFDAMLAARDRHPAVADTLEEASDVLGQDLVALPAGSTWSPCCSSAGPKSMLRIGSRSAPCRWRHWRGTKTS